MNRRLLIIATTLATLILGSANAQGDNLLQRYDLAIENLEIAVESVPDDGVQARDELERALNALLTLSTNATSPTLVSAMERTFDRTRIAIENQSRTDMAVQTAVLAGGFARLVMDSAYATAAAGDLELARSRLTHLAQELAFGPETVQALQEADDAASMRFAFEAGAADSIAARVEAAEELALTDRAAAYEQLATGYGQSLLIQDSPRVGAELNRALVNAANALVEGDVDAAGEALQASESQLASLGEAARAQAPGTPQAAGTTPAPEGEAGTPPADGQPAVPVTEPGATPGQVPGDEPTTSQTPEEAPAATPGATTAQAEPAQQAGPDDDLLPLLSGPDFENALQARLDELAAEREAADLAVLSRELTLAGVPPAVAQSEAEQLMASGFLSLADTVTGIEAAAARVVAGQRSGDVAGARAEIENIRTTYQGALASIMLTADPDVARRTEELLASLGERTNLTSHDVTLLAAQTAAVRSALLGGAPPAGQELELTVDSFWSTLTRPLVFIILALLAIVPLVLLNLAFGGSNRNWRLVGWSLFFLLLPVFYEGLVALAGLVNRFADVPWLASLTSWSSFSSTVAQVVWAALVLLALVLAIVGLYGICVQFGLLGSGRQRTVTTTTTTAERRPTGNTTIDWDEEF